MRPRLRRAALTDRLLARALALGATSEHPTAPAVNALWRLAGGDHEALERALARIDHPSGSVGHPRTIARALLRSAIDLEAPCEAAAMEQPAPE